MLGKMIAAHIYRAAVQMRMDVMEARLIAVETHVCVHRHMHMHVQRMRMSIQECMHACTCACL
jgi:hypothetical protein